MGGGENFVDLLDDAEEAFGGEAGTGAGARGGIGGGDGGGGGAYSDDEFDPTLL